VNVASVFPQLERLLPLVSKPIQYVGGELNSLTKEWDSASVRWALDSAITTNSGTKNIRPRAPRDPGVLTVAAPSVAWLSGTYLSYVEYATAVKLASTAGSTVMLRENGRFAARPSLLKRDGRFAGRVT